MAEKPGSPDRDTSKLENEELIAFVRDRKKRVGYVPERYVMALCDALEAEARKEAEGGDEISLSDSRLRAIEHRIRHYFEDNNTFEDMSSDMRVRWVEDFMDSDALPLVDAVRRQRTKIRELEERNRSLVAAYEGAIQHVRGCYPEDVFLPDSDSPDAKAAKVARHVCDEISRLSRIGVEALDEGGDDGR